MGTTNFDVVQANTFVGAFSPTLTSYNAIEATTIVGDKSTIGPLAGGYIMPVVTIPDNAVTSTSSKAIFNVPAGMTASLVGVSIRAASVTSDPAIEIGNTTDTDGYVVATNLTTLVQNPAIGGALAVSGRGPVASGGKIVMIVTNDTGDGFGAVQVGLTLLVTANATNVPTSLF
jgi:hypothetical protein